jgi:hypothetical protein
MADIIINPGSSIMSFTSSLNYTQTLTQDASGSLILAGSGSTGRTDLFTVNGNNGTLFSVSDDLSDSLFSVNTIAGLPVIEAFANNTVVMGQYGQNVLVVTGSRVGIGTSTPLAVLDVYQSGQPQVRVRGTAGANHLYQDSTTGTATGDGLFVGIGGDQTAYIWHYESNSMIFGTGNTERMRILSGGNIGIGTTNPGETLTVNGAIGLQSSGTQKYHIRYYSGGLNFSETGVADYRLFIKDGGNVGIGTTSFPSSTYKFVVKQGTDRILGIAEQSSDLSIEAYNDAQNANVPLRIYSSKLQLLNGDVGIGTTSPSSVSNYRALTLDATSGTFTEYRQGGTNILRIGVDSSRPFIYGDSNAPLDFYTNASFRMRLAANGDLLVGTQTSIHGTSGRGVIQINGSSNAILSLSTGDTNAGYIYHTGTDMYLWNYKNGAMNIGTNNVERITILAGGNVGIGTNSPTEVLDVRGTIRVSKSGVNDSGILAFGNYANGAGYYDNGIFRSALNDISTSGNKLHIASYEGLVFTTSAHAFGSQAIRMYIDGSSGYVGIGTTSPSARLDIRSSASSGATNAPTFRAFGLDTDSYFEVNNNANNSADIKLTRSDGATMFKIDGHSGVTHFDGNVGIGITNPSQKLHVVGGTVLVKGITGTPAWDNNTLELRSAGSDNVSIDFHRPGYSSTQIWSNGNNIIFGTDSGTERMRIQAGNIGIGTTSPQGKLSVDGGDFRFNYGNASANYYLYLNKKASQDGGILWTRDNSTFDWQTVNLDNSGNLSFYSYGSSTHAITFQKSAGNIGINTTSPDQKLHVVGNAAITGFTSTGGRKLSLGILDINVNLESQIRINTNIPFASSNADFTVNIKGFRYGSVQMVSLSIGWHYYLGSFYNETAISNGAWKPTISLARDANGYVVIHLSNPDYWAKLYVESVYSSNYGDVYSSGWTWTNADLSNCTNVEVVPYASLATDISGNAGSTSAVSGTTNYVSKFTSGTAIGNSLIYDNGTNVGIGNTSPNGALSFADDVKTRKIVLWDGAANDDFQFYGFGVESSTMIQSVYSNNDRFLWVAGTGTTTRNELMVVTGNGAVGIGTTNPSAKLDINGGDGTPAGEQFAAVIKGHSGGNRTMYFDGATQASVWWGSGNTPQFALDSISGGGATFWTNDGSNWSEKMRILVGGNIGIGNTTPGAVLTVGTQSAGTSGTGVAADNSIVARFGASNTAARVTGITISNTATATVGNDASLSFIVAGNYSATGMISTILRNTSTAVSDMAFSTYNGSGLTESMRITGGGNVGIGTTNPSQKLHIVGTDAANNGITIQNTNSSGNSQLRFLNTSGTEKAAITYVNSADAVYHYTSAGGNLFNLVGANVGINTTNPSGQLSGTKGLSIVDATNAALGLSNGTNHWLNYLSGTTYRIWNNSVSEVMTILLNGNIGIGTTSPSVKFEVSGQAFVDKFQYTQAIQISGGDLNSLTTAGFYAGSGMSNAPNTGWFYVTVERHSDASWVHQTATSFGAGNTANEVYTRVRVSGTWGSWLQVVTANGSSWNINAATATNLSTDRTNWNTNGTISAVVGQLAWKNYGNNHTIFDASNSTSPAGGSISNTNPDVAWTGTYPTLMGWNGSNTYGVRVDSARTSDSTSAVSGTTNYIPKFTSGTAIGNSVIYDNSGNIGIGITSPSSKLHLSGTTTLLTITDTSYNRTSEIGYLDSANLYLANDSNSNTYVGRYNNLFLAYGGGNVGINTTSPSAKLHVVGDAIVTNITYDESSLGTANVAGEVVYFGGGSGLTPGNLVYLNSSGNWADAQANATSTSTGLLGIALSTVGSKGVLVRGNARFTANNSYTGVSTIGAPLYMSAATAGAFTQTAPTTPGQTVRIIGYVESTSNDQIYFCPDTTWVQL